MSTNLLRYVFYFMFLAFVGCSLTISYLVTDHHLETGAQGMQGEPGIEGESGDKGDTGATGAKGAKGDEGKQGATGAKGEPAKVMRSFKSSSIPGHEQ